MTSDTRAREHDDRAAWRPAGGQRAVDRLEHLNEIARLLAIHQTVEQTCDAALAVAARILPLGSAILIEDHPDGHKITLGLPDGRSRESAAAAIAHAEATLRYLVGAGSQGQGRTGRAGLADLPEPADAGPESAQKRRFIVLPLVVADRPVFGVLQVEAVADRFDKQDLVFVSAIANQLAVALDRDRAWRRDIARREHAEAMEETLRAQAEALVAADRQRSEFLSVLADELRASLAAFREIQQSLREEAGSDRIDRTVRTINGQIQQMAQLIDDLHGLSNLTWEQVRVLKTRVEIAAILARAARRGSERLSAQGQTLTVALPSEPAYLEADAVRIEQVFDTLIDKASLLASPGGRIWLAARIVAAGNAEPVLAGMPQVVVTLRDDGAGAVKAILPRVFDLLNPAGRQIDPADGRFGSGLKLMRRIVELHGGVVCATSSGLGQGSEFEVRLPIGARQVPFLGPERRSS